MTKEEAEQKVYRLVLASPFGVGFIQNDRGIRTWWSNDFDRKFPTLDHPKIQEAIEINEQMNKGQL